MICSKSRWNPAIRREHALAQLAADAGVQVTFVERPGDIRALATARQAPQWWNGLRARPDRTTVREGLEVVPTSVVLPGHRGRAGEHLSTWLLARALRRVAGLDEAVVVVDVPWQWPAAAAVCAHRRVFDCADDWSEQMPHRKRRLTELYARIDREADAITLANPVMIDRFPSGRTVVVRNGVAPELLAPLTDRPTDKRMVCAGTLSPRFDTLLAAEVLSSLPDWTLDLYGQCQYPGRGERPGKDLRLLLSRHASQVRYHGVVRRGELASAIDRATVAVVLNRADASNGQDSMKLYDYAARGRPIVSTRFSPTLDQQGPPHLVLADTPAEFTKGLRESLAEPKPWALERRQWAEEQRWERRWPTWARAIFG